MSDNAAGVRPAGAGPDTGDDAWLITRSLSAPGCFGLLFDRHAPAVHWYIARRWGLMTLMTWSRRHSCGFQKRVRYDVGQVDARPWLYGIATRLVGQHRRDAITPDGSTTYTTDTALAPGQGGE